MINTETVTYVVQFLLQNLPFKSFLNNTLTNFHLSNSTDTNPCSTVLCPIGTVCQLEQVYCIKAPCPKLPNCVPVTGTFSYKYMWKLY